MSKEANVIEREACLSEDDLLFDSADVSPTYLKKALLASNAIDNIGFGKYQKGLFVVAGFGWFADNAFPVATSYILQRLNENDKVHYPPGRAPYLTLGQNLGLLAGAFVWSLAADIIGRRWVFSFTFLFTSVFSIVAGASPNFAAAGTFCALWSFGVGGKFTGRLGHFPRSASDEQKMAFDSYVGVVEYWSSGHRAYLMGPYFQLQL